MGLTPVFEPAAKTCSNVYCHGDFTGGANVSADWDAGTGGACGDCHSTTNPGSGKHDIHTGGGAGEYDFDCSTCHENRSEEHTSELQSH